MDHKLLKCLNVNCNLLEPHLTNSSRIYFNSFEVLTNSFSKSINYYCQITESILKHSSPYRYTYGVIDSHYLIE